MLSAAAMLTMAVLVLTIVTIYAISNITSHHSDTKTLPARERNLAQQFMLLELTNQARTEAGAQPLILGNNPAAQIHADQSINQCGGGHWDLYGLKPYMRYSLTGGYHQNAETWFSRSTCGYGSIWYNPATSPETVIKHAFQAFIKSPGHREALLNPHYQMVNIGMAWDRQNFIAVQHFESDYLTFETLPSINKNQLHLKATLNDNARFSPGKTPLVLVSYDPPPRPLNRDQLTRTGCYQPGIPILRLLPRPHPNQKYSLSQATIQLDQHSCPDPYKATGDEPPAQQTHRAQEPPASDRRPQTVIVLFHQADQWEVTPNSIELNANLSQTLQSKGPGIYAVSIYAEVQGKQIKVSDFSIFHQTHQPEPYLQETLQLPQSEDKSTSTQRTRRLKP